MSKSCSCCLYLSCYIASFLVYPFMTTSTQHLHVRLIPVVTACMTFPLYTPLLLFFVLLPLPQFDLTLHHSTPPPLSPN
jgi:hypothetical protein